MMDDGTTRRRAEGAGNRAAGSVWWGNGPGATLARTVLLPFEWAYRCVVAVRNALHDRGFRVRRPPIRVLSVGNLTVGGAGKTPVARFLAESIAGRGGRPAILHRGYGSGDEPALHRSWNPDIPVYTGADRVATAMTAAAAGATVAILDDGFQHRRIARDLDVVLVAAEDWTRSPRLLPRGPWRETPAAIRRADLAIVTRKTATADRSARVAQDIAAVGVEVARIALEPAGWRYGGSVAEAPPPEPALAVVAMARPEAFLGSAAAAGARIAEVLLLRDHHAFDESDARAILGRAGDRPIVTSEKEAVHLLPLLPAARLWILLQRVRVEEGEAVIDRALDRFA